MKALFAFLVLFSTTAFGQASKDKLIATCELSSMNIEIYYTKRIKNGVRQVRAVFSARGYESQKKTWAALGWDVVNEKKAFVVAADGYGLALVDGDSSDNRFFAAALPGGEAVHCKNDLSAVRKDFPN